jgi:hypothetical protein
MLESAIVAEDSMYGALLAMTCCLLPKTMMIVVINAVAARLGSGLPPLKRTKRGTDQPNFTSARGLVTKQSIDVRSECLAEMMVFARVFKAPIVAD